ncbi:septal ring lytic transglycosylase RlpA family protein [Idiomarina xiamenensis]|uniref:Endolytic peptidoglycan transglycosylase RlpA n=1 Tax=Idiomarina xiamenensis 10-D-4 TaxID=740709 RepID=K2KYM6_9GAMM|nr:septal ring lytic transglycosylase RlpA family protein [Idiomarina xiamenensis]EKE82810.1 rare lipoprotein A [Idiomarina xiamenensis 10-D-4]
MGLLLLSACSSSSGPNSGRYKHDNDSAPTRMPTAAELRDPIPKVEPLSRGGNRQYELFGNTYSIIEDTNNFVQEGKASWYGRKFHGHLTSSGEFYDMYSMSAAHKRLPLPTYVRVTNLDNNKSVIVRVNDRGPFHQDRIIDVSYSAAYKLGMLQTGTANVRIESIAADQQPATPVLPLPQGGTEAASVTQTHYFIQVVAAANQQRLSTIADQLSQQHNVPATTEQDNGLYKVMLGPLPELAANRLLTAVRQQGYDGAFRVKAADSAAAAPEK